MSKILRHLQFTSFDTVKEQRRRNSGLRADCGEVKKNCSLRIESLKDLKYQFSSPWIIWRTESSWFISRRNLFNSRIPFHSSRKLIILQSVIYPLASITMRFSWTFHVAWHLSKRIASASLFSECVVSINLRILKHFLFSFCRLLCRQILRQWQSDFWHLYYHLIKVSSSLSFFYFGWQRFSFPFKSECRATKWRFIAVTFFFNGNW